MSDPLNTADWIFRLIMRAYPPQYLETFGNEMRQTFQEGANEAKSQGRLSVFVLRELLDTPRVIASAYWNEWKKKLNTRIQILQEVASTDDLPPSPRDGRSSWLQVLLETSLFLIAGLLLIGANYLPFDGLIPGWQRNLGLLGKIVIPISIPIFLLGLFLGLPRWAYPFGGLFIGYQLLIAHQASIWLFLLAMLLVACVLALASILTDPQPALLPVLLRRVGQSLCVDWTRLSFALYGAMPCVIMLAFDDAYYNNRTPYFFFSVLAMVMCAVTYCRSRVETVQIATLLVGLTFSIYGSLLDQISFAGRLTDWILVSWQGGGTSNIWLLEMWVQWMVILLFPALLIMLGRVVIPKHAI